MKPIAAPNSITSTIAGQMFMSSRVVSTPSRRPELPTITPAERSNSPPIIRSATGTATIPYWAAWSVHWLAMPRSESSRVPRAVQANRKNTATAPDERAEIGPLDERRQQVDARDTLVRRGLRSAAAVPAIERTPFRRAGGCRAARPADRT